MRTLEPLAMTAEAPVCFSMNANPRSGPRTLMAVAMPSASELGKKVTILAQASGPFEDCRTRAGFTK